MIETNQIERLAAMGNALRPDWPVRSLYTHLAKSHAHRAFRDLAVALAYVAADPATTTPARLTENGPWWTATRNPNDPTPGIPKGRCVGCGGMHDPADGHTPREDERTNGTDQLRRVLADVRERLCSHGVPATNCTDHDTPTREAS